MSATVLVTGGSGFIGTWVLRELLARGAQPVAFDLQPAPERWQKILRAVAAGIQFEQGSLLDRERLQNVCDKHRVTHVIHLAALLTPACQQDPWAGAQVNIMGSMALWEMARSRRTPLQGFSYASSFAVYGPEADDFPTTGGASRNQTPTFYGAFKQAVDQIAQQYWRHYKVAAVGIRPHVVYGPQRDQGLTAGPSLAAKAAALGESFTIGYRGRVGYNYVEDVARAFVRAAWETPPAATVVDMPGDLATCEDFVRAIVAVVPTAQNSITIDGPEIPSNIPPHPSDIANLFPDWESTSLTEGVRRTIDFYRQSR